MFSQQSDMAGRKIYIWQWDVHVTSGTLSTETAFHVSARNEQVVTYFFLTSQTRKSLAFELADTRWGVYVYKCICSH